MTAEATITEIEQLCRRYSHSGVNLGAHALAWRIVTMIEKHKSNSNSNSEANNPSRKRTEVDGQTQGQEK